MRVAILDDAGLLIGAKEVKKLKAGDVECGDLPTDGSYRFKEGQFIHKAHGKGKPTNPGVTPYKALYLLIRSIERGEPMPQECSDWATWYETFGGDK